MRAYKVQNNSVLAFIDELCVIEPDAVCHRQELYDEFISFCEATNLGKFSQPKFNSEMANQRGIAAANDSVTRRAIFKGVRLK